MDTYERPWSGEVPALRSRLLHACLAIVALTGALGSVSANSPTHALEEQARAATIELGTTAASGNAPGTEQTLYELLVMPDFLNADIADVTKSRYYSEGSPNSTNESWETAIDVTLDHVQSEGVNNVAVTGDLVEGHWGVDTSRTGTFGPTNTFENRVRASRQAGNLYYTQWQQRFARRGLRTYAAVGDHEIGDDPWFNKRNSASVFNKFDFKWEDFHNRKKTFSKNVLQANRGFARSSRPKGPAADTAYLTRLHPEVWLITLDVFKRTDRSVVTSIDKQQLKWLQRVLTKANRQGVDWTVVQGHTPIIGPVRRRASSGLMYRGQASSKLWSVLRNKRVDLYLGGEVHAVTAHQPAPRDPVQTSAGGMLQHGGANYAVLSVKDNKTMDIVVHNVPCDGVKTGSRLWQTDNKRPVEEIDCTGGKIEVGGASIDASRSLVSRTGLLAPYDGSK